MSAESVESLLLNIAGRVMNLSDKKKKCLCNTFLQFLKSDIKATVFYSATFLKRLREIDLERCQLRKMTWSKISFEIGISGKTQKKN